MKVGKDVYVRHANDQELPADSCAARLLSEAFTQPGELALTINAFIKQLPPSRWHDSENGRVLGCRHRAC